MTQTFKVLKEVNMVSKSIWFTPARASESDKNDPLNVRQQQASRLDIRKQFYSQRVVDVPTDIKNSVTVSGFKMAYKKHREELEATT